MIGHLFRAVVGDVRHGDSSAPGGIHIDVVEPRAAHDDGPKMGSLCERITSDPYRVVAHHHVGCRQRRSHVGVRAAFPHIELGVDALQRSLLDRPVPTHRRAEAHDPRSGRGGHARPSLSPAARSISSRFEKETDAALSEMALSFIRARLPLPSPRSVGIESGLVARYLRHETTWQRIASGVHAS
jgi:hypothetical protein